MYPPHANESLCAWQQWLGDVFFLNSSSHEMWVYSALAKTKPVVGAHFVSCWLNFNFSAIRCAWLYTAMKMRNS